MDFSLFILILDLMASVLLHFSFSALIFNLCLRKIVFCGHFISDEADTLLRATPKEVSNMSIGRDNVNMFKLIYLSVTLMWFFFPRVFLNGTFQCGADGAVSLGGGLESSLDKESPFRTPRGPSGWPGEWLPRTFWGSGDAMYFLLFSTLGARV